MTAARQCQRTPQQDQQLQHRSIVVGNRCGNQPTSAWDGVLAKVRDSSGDAPTCHLQYNAHVHA